MRFTEGEKSYLNIFVFVKELLTVLFLCIIKGTYVTRFEKNIQISVY